MENLVQELKKLVSLCGWTYAVVWKIGPDHRTPIWHQSYFNEFEEREIGQAQRFENIFKSCQFTADRPGYAYLAWLRQSPYWWSRQLMVPVPTDENKELFLTEAKIQTLVCFPGRLPADGSGYCVEVASTSPVSENEAFKASIRDFISTSIAPHISSTSSYPLLQEMSNLEAITSSTSMSVLEAAQAGIAAAVAQQQDSAILTDITSQAAIHGEDDAIVGFGNIVRSDEPYYPWTQSTSHYVSAGLSNYPLANFGDYNYPNFDIGTFSYGGSSPVLDPFQAVEPSPEWAPAASGTATTTAHGSSKGKEILVEPEPELGSSTHRKQSQTIPPTSPNLSSLQQEFLDKLRKPPSLQQQTSGLGPSAEDSSQMVLVHSGVTSSGFQISSSASSAGVRPISGQVPPGHSPTSKFQPRRYPQFPVFGASSKRPSLIHKWATSLAPQIVRMRRGMQGPGSGGAERPGSFESPGGLNFDPRSPNSRMLDYQAAEIHKLKERKRRSKMNNKLRTLISIVPIIDKKDKVSVLTSTIEYIRQLTSRISNLDNREETAAAPATTSRMEEEASMSMDREEELQLLSNVDTGGAGPSSSFGGPVAVEIEDSPDGETWLIKVQANNHTRSLIQLLNVFQELGLEIITVDYGATNGRFRANLCIKDSRNSSTSSSVLKETLRRVLETGDSSLTGSE
ncbi:hypothetical protein KC19_3G072100 [Ceratodon purpureus]|uniref:BHLH domain-containing protein n=1 Tax=Ceratodon purpureus TaxID=3225 RepID=A0A8T0IJF9_CERPU|nr:hypothetical protein KC19_3G072100 [Ceratodon purpureus]